LLITHLLITFITVPLIDNKLKSFQVRGKLPQWAIWLIAVALFTLAWTGVGIWSRHTALTDLAKHTDSWEEGGVLFQPTDYSCVPASVAMLLRDFGIDITLLESATYCGTDTFGTSGSGIKRTGRRFGFDVTRVKMEFDEFLQDGRPGIILFRKGGTPHAAYIKPLVDEGLIEMKDPVQGLLWFEKLYADEYFGSERWEIYLFDKPD